MQITRHHQLGTLWPRAQSLTLGWATILVGGAYSLLTPMLMIGGLA